MKGPSWGLIVAMVLVALLGCGQPETPKQTYAEALQIYTAERAELDRISKLHLERLDMAEEATKTQLQKIASLVELEDMRLPFGRHLTKEEKVKRGEELLREDMEPLKFIAKLRKEEGELRKKVLAQEKRLADAEATKESLAP